MQHPSLFPATTSNMIFNMATRLSTTSVVNGIDYSITIAAEEESNADPNDVVYFDELDGYFYLHNLGVGADGTVQLCRSRRTGALTVRKEDRQTVDIHHIGSASTVTDVLYSFNGANTGDRIQHREATLPSYEVEIAQSLQHVPEVINLEASVLHYGLADTLWTEPKNHLGHSFDRGLQVSYWKHYNLGTLKDVIRLYGSFIPEYWVSQFLASMIDTLISIHQHKVVHRDAHSENWFVNHEEGVPSVYLGDFGRAAKASDLDDSALFGQRQYWDFDPLSKIVSEFLKSNVHRIAMLDSTRCGRKGFPYSSAFLILVQQFHVWLQSHAARSPPVSKGARSKRPCEFFSEAEWQKAFHSHAESIASKAGVPRWTLIPVPVSIDPVSVSELVPRCSAAVVHSRTPMNYYISATVVEGDSGKSLRINDSTQDTTIFCPYQSLQKIEIDYKPRNDNKSVYQILSPAT